MNKQAVETLTQERLKEVLDYNPITGIFVRKARNHGVKVGSIAGVINNFGYITIGVDGKRYLAHRLAWLYMEGYLPEHDIDHLNGSGVDNRWENLRHVSRGCNLQNKAISTRNTSGFPGVSWGNHARKWRSQAMVDQKTIHLGCYIDPLDAALARLTFEEQCSKWICNHRSELIRAIKSAWPDFRAKPKSGYEMGSVGSNHK